MKHYISVLLPILIVAIKASAQEFYRLNFNDIVIDGDSIVEFKWSISPDANDIYHVTYQNIIIPSEYTDNNDTTHRVKKIGQYAFIYSDDIFKQKKI